MKAIVIGATGATGKCLIEQLLADARFSEVTALVRRKSFDDHQKLTEIIVDFDHLPTYTNDVTGDVAFSCMGTTLKTAGSKDAQWKIDYDYQYQFAALAKKNNIPTFVLVSAINSNADSSIFYSKMKGQLEKEIIKLEFDKTLVFQPSILIRPNTDRIGEKIALGIMRGISKLGILKNHRPTHVRDLAKAMITSSSHSKPGVNYIRVKEIHQLAQ
jgi:uncharacterized protein YbjT (DUF2867 family)